LDAYEGSCAHESDWPLVLSMNAMREAAGLRWLGSLEEREARCLLKAAGALAFPSEYEGFGLPPVEAAAMGGIPLLVSKIPAHQEALVDLGPDEVCWLSPGDCHAWERALTRVISGEIPGVSRATQGKVRTRYSAGNLGTHMDRIYRRVLGLSQ
jgi:glycosyltransferase involved in cell wall biosynthesis